MVDDFGLRFHDHSHDTGADYIGNTIAFVPMMYTYRLHLLLKQQKRRAAREQSARFSLSVQGRCVKLAYTDKLRRNALTVDSLQLSRSRRVKRGKVVRFSRRSRRRLMELFHRLHYDTADVTAFFITLTYEDMHMLRPVWKDDVKLLLRRLERYFKREYGVAISAIWRLELQKRGMPHFHIVLFAYGADLYLKWKVVSDYWGETVGLAFNGYPPRVDVQVVRSFERLAFYVSKYVAKLDDALSLSKASYSDGFSDGLGRWWGVYRRARLPYARRYVLSVPYPVWLDARRLVKRLTAARAGRRQYRRGVPQGCTYYSRDALSFVRFALHYGYRRSKCCLYRVVWSMGH